MALHRAPLQTRPEAGTGGAGWGGAWTEEPCTVHTNNALPFNAFLMYARSQPENESTASGEKTRSWRKIFVLQQISRTE